MVVTNNSSSPKNKFFKFFRNTADDSISMAVNGSVTAVPFRITATNGSIEVTRVNVTLIDGAIRYGQYGGLGAALTNGITVRAHDVDDTVLCDYLDGETIKANEDWGWLAGADNIVIQAAGDDSFPVRWTIEKSGKKSLLTEGQYIEIKISDNVAGLTKHTAFAQGVNL